MGNPPVFTGGSPKGHYDKGDNSTILKSSPDGKGLSKMLQLYRHQLLSRTRWTHNYFYAPWSPWSPSLSKSI